MKKIALFGFLIAFMAIVLSGCSNTPQTTTDSVDPVLVKSYMLKACSQATQIEFGEGFLQSEDAIMICFNTLNEYYDNEESWPADQKTVVSGDYSAGYYVSLQIAKSWGEEIDFSSAAYPDGEIHQYYRTENAVSSILDALKAVRLEMEKEGVILSP